MVRRRRLVLFALLPLLLGAGVFRGGTTAQDEDAAVLPTSGPSCARVPEFPVVWEPNAPVPGIYVMNPDGSGQTNLSGDLPDVAAPAWSPDGTRLAFLSADRLYVVGADGSAPVRLADEVATGRAAVRSAPVWSPDGARLLLVVEEVLYAVDAAGAGVTKVTDWVAAGSPSWSPDGRTIAVAALPPGEAYPEVFLVGVDGADRRPLTDLPGETVVMTPVWSPDGRTIAFVTQSDQEAWYGLFVVNADGSGLRKLGFAIAGELAWSPDGAALAFLNYLGDGYVAEAYQIYRIGADGGGARCLVVGGTSPAWSPDGRAIAYASYAGDVWTMDPSGSGHARLARGGFAPRWSPDGVRIAFVRPPTPDADDVPGEPEQPGAYGEVAGPPPTPSGGTSGGEQPTATPGGAYGDYGGGNARTACEHSGPTPAPGPTPTPPAPTPAPASLDAVGLYVVGADGSGLRHLRWDASAPTWSPDGTRLAFVGRDGIYAMDADGTGEVRVTRAATDWLAEPVWSSDGTKLGFFDVDEVFACVVGLDGAVVTKAPLPAWEFAWSPDLAEIAVASSDVHDPELYVARADGSGRRRVTDLPPQSGGGILDPRWAPDGTKIAFALQSPEAPDAWGSPHEAGVYGGPGTTAEAGADGTDDGQQVGPASGSPAAVEHLAGFYVANVDGSGQTRLTHEQPHQAAVWSPDSTRLLFCTCGASVVDLYRVDADGTDRTNLTGDHDGGVWQFAWSPDGARIAFADGQRLVVMNADGTDMAEVARMPGDINALAWSPDGATIAFATWPHDPGADAAGGAAGEPEGPGAYGEGAAGTAPILEVPTVSPPTCADFATQQHAQRYFDARANDAPQEVAGLDLDGDDVACDDHDYGGRTTPHAGGAYGGGYGGGTYGEQVGPTPTVPAGTAAGNGRPGGTS